MDAQPVPGIEPRLEIRDRKIQGVVFPRVAANVSLSFA